jgi:hypothetical protein
MLNYAKSGYFVGNLETVYDFANSCRYPSELGELSKYFVRAVGTQDLFNLPDPHGCRILYMSLIKGF